MLFVLIFFSKCVKFGTSVTHFDKNSKFVESGTNVTHFEKNSKCVNRVHSFFFFHFTLSTYTSPFLNDTALG